MFRYLYRDFTVPFDLVIYPVRYRIAIGLGRSKVFI